MTAIKENDKVLGAAINVAAIFFPYAGPIVGIVICAKSPFARFQGYRSLIGQLVATVLVGFLMLCSLAYSIYSLYHQMEGGFDWSKIDWVAILIKAVITWILVGIWELINLILSIRDAVEALHGKLPSRPNWVERKALHFSGMDKVLALE